MGSPTLLIRQGRNQVAQLLRALVTSDIDEAIVDRLERATCETNEVVRNRIDSVFDALSVSDARLRRVLHGAFSTKHDFDRALFVRLGFESVRGNWTTTDDAMISSELLYASVVILDDIVDHGEQRHGAPCLYKELGVAPSIYVAEVYRSLAMSALLRACTKVGLSGQQQARLLERWEHATREVNTGQFMDVRPKTSRPEQVADDEYLSLIRQTTGADIACCLVTGAMLTATNEPTIDTLDSLGNLLGTAMQVRDDILDYCVDPSSIDKSSGLDLVNGRLRLPLIHACRVSSEVRRLVGEARGHRDPAVCEALRDAVLDTGGLARAGEVLSSLQAQVSTVLVDLPGGSSQQLLHDVNACLSAPHVSSAAQRVQRRTG